MGMNIYEAQRMVRGASMPWENNRRAKEPTYIGIDGKEEMMRCFNCTKEVCDDCVAKKTRAEKISETQSLIEKLSKQELTVKEICATLDISRRTYYYYKERMKKNESK